MSGITISEFSEDHRCPTAFAMRRLLFCALPFVVVFFEVVIKIRQTFLLAIILVRDVSANQ